MTSNLTQIEITQRSHRRAVRFFWGFLIGATTVSLVGNITHAVLPYIPHVAIQIGAAAVPPIALLAAVHGIALAVRAGASGRVYSWAVAAVAAIGVGAFSVSFLALRDLMRVIGYSSASAWIFPAIIDTAVAVSTMMLVALGDKPRVTAARGQPQVLILDDVLQSVDAHIRVALMQTSTSRVQVLAADRHGARSTLARAASQTVSGRGRPSSRDRAAGLELHRGLTHRSAQPRSECGVTYRAADP
jgi:hypothetical protein